MTETNLYIVRHGKTMFNSLTRVQGWCDTPLTKSGRQGIHYVGLGLQDTNFVEAYSSDSGRAIETMRILLGEHPTGKEIPYHVDPRIREWCFGSLEGAYDAEMWGVIPRVLNFKTEDDMFATDVTFQEIADAVYNADTANWAETYEKLRSRVWEGFEDIAQRREKDGGGNVLIVSHGLTIAFLLNLIDSDQPVRANLLNGSINQLNYKEGKFTIKAINDISYMERGKMISDQRLA
ncbi:histidine phosphatase family protein [Enterococcus sp. CSURQ0835]|uniref:histidine phosphatase family protein n=1 Tax=Enterococcus sp. CSURQ0835 TaxID=2681394 RepID=UPI00135A9870|nr:histidine phosphatase family protein [Enterococcus sp. CSURQ0835]